MILRRCVCDALGCRSQEPAPGAPAVAIDDKDAEPVAAVEMTRD